MAREPGEREQDPQVQYFDIGEALTKRDAVHGRVDMANSSNCFIAVFKTPPGGGELRYHQHPDSDQILVVVKGELAVGGPGAERLVKENQGVLIPAGAYYGFKNRTQEDVVFLSLRTESSGGRYVAYDPNRPSDVLVRIPAEELAAKGIGSRIYLYALDRHTIGVSPHLLHEWNAASLLRMHCEWDRSGQHILANLPERMVKWYKIDDLTDSDYHIVADPENTRVRVDLTPLLDRQAGRR